MKVRSFFPVTLFIDEEKIVIRIKRMNMEEHSEFSSRFAMVSIPTFARFVSRASSGPEQEQNDKGEYVIPLEKIASKWLDGLAPEKRLEYETAVEAEETEARQFLSWTFEHFVTVERGLIEETPEGKEQTVTEGLDLLRIFGAREDVIQQILGAVRRENEFDVEQKKTWGLPTASSPSSIGRRPGRAGKKRKTTAKNAAIKDSQNKGGAALSQSGQSGSTGISSSNLAPS